MDEFGTGSCFSWRHRCVTPFYFFFFGQRLRYDSVSCFRAASCGLTFGADRRGLTFGADRRKRFQFATASFFRQ
jgi:hypothetical protein